MRHSDRWLKNTELRAPPNNPSNKNCAILHPPKRPSAFRKEKSLAYNKGKAFWRNTGSESSRRNKAGDLIDAGNHWKVDINLHDLFEGCNQSAWRHERRWTGARCTFRGGFVGGGCLGDYNVILVILYIYIYTCIEETTIQLCTIHTKYVSLFHPFHRLD